MTIALDPTKDVLVPVKTFKQLASANKFDEYEELAGEVQEHLNLKENQIESDAKYKFLKRGSDEFKALERGFKQLDGKIRGFPDNQELWLIRCFLAPFEGRITDPAKMIWETLESASGTANLTQVEREAREFQQTRKRNYQALATACQALQTSCSTVSDALAAFTTALTTGGAVPTAPTPAPAPTLATVRANLAKSENAAVLTALAIPADQVPTLPWEDSGETLGLRTKILQALADSAKSAIVRPFLTANGITGTDPRTIPERLTESKILRNLKQEKKLYLAGFSTRSEYMARLLEAKIMLNEVTDAENAERTKIKTFVDSMTYNLLPTGTLATGLQDGLTRINQTLDRLQESLKRLKTTKMLHSKGLISNTEYMATLVEVKKNIEENKKIQLNEFFLITALFAALGAVFGWFTAKWAANRFGAYGSPGNHDSRRGNNQQIRGQDQAQQSVTSILAGLGGGLDAEGRVVGVDGRPAPNPSEELAKLKKDMASAKTNLTRLVGEATPLLAASPTKIAQRVAATSNQEQINTTGATLLSTITTQDLVAKVTAVENGITTLEGTP